MMNSEEVGAETDAISAPPCGDEREAREDLGRPVPGVPRWGLGRGAVGSSGPDRSQGPLSRSLWACAPPPPRPNAARPADAAGPEPVRAAAAPRGAPRAIRASGVVAQSQP